jgi:hypothetical protein
LQQLLLVLLLLTAGMVLWMGNNHNWPDLHSLLTAHPGFTPQISATTTSSSSSSNTSSNSSSAGAHAHAHALALAGTSTVTQTALQPQTLRKFGEQLEFPLWWHAPFISQSGGLLTAADFVQGRLPVE